MIRPERCFHLSATVNMRRRRVRKSFHLRIQPLWLGDDLCNLNGDPNSLTKLKEIGSPGNNSYDKGAKSTRVMGQASYIDRGSMSKMKDELELIPHSVVVLLALYILAFQEC